MVRVKKELNAKMREIIRILHKKGGYMSAHEIAAETGFSYVTVRKYLEELVKKEVILAIEDGSKKTGKKETSKAGKNEKV